MARRAGAATQLCPAAGRAGGHDQGALEDDQGDAELRSRSSAPRGDVRVTHEATWELLAELFSRRWPQLAQPRPGQWEEFRQCPELRPAAGGADLDVETIRIGEAVYAAGNTAGIEPEAGSPCAGPRCS